MRTHFFWVLATLIITACNNKQKENDNTASDDSKIWNELPTVAAEVTTNGTTLMVCDWTAVKDSIHLPLSYFIEDLDIVKLDNKDEALVRNSSVTVSDNYILIHCSQNIPFKLFDRKGKFLRNIGSVGNGPGEYTQVGPFQLDEKHDRIYLMPWNATKLITYNLNGELQKNIPLIDEAEKWMLPKSVFYADGDKGRITVATLPWKNNPRMIWVQDFEGNRLAELSPITEMKPDYSNDIYHNNNTEAFDFSFLDFHIEKADTLYHYDYAQNKLQPTFTIHFSGGKIPIHWQYEYPTCFIGTVVGKMEQTDNHGGSETREHRNFIVDKKTLKGGLYKVHNDFLGGGDAFWFASCRNGYYIRNVDPGVLKEELETALKTTNLLPEIREKVNTLASSIQENDNNYLLIGRMKQMNDKH